MIRVYERSLCQSYASAAKKGIVVAECETEAEARDAVIGMTCDNYRCFAVLDDGTVLDADREYPGLLWKEMTA